MPTNSFNFIFKQLGIIPAFDFAPNLSYFSNLSKLKQFTILIILSLDLKVSFQFKRNKFGSWQTLYFFWNKLLLQILIRREIKLCTENRPEIDTFFGENKWHFFDFFCSFEPCFKLFFHVD